MKPSERSAIERRRREIAKAAIKSLKDYHSGKLIPLTAEAAIKELNFLYPN